MKLNLISRTFYKNPIIHYKQKCTTMDIYEILIIDVGNQKVNKNIINQIKNTFFENTHHLYDIYVESDCWHYQKGRILTIKATKREDYNPNQGEIK